MTFRDVQQITTKMRRDLELVAATNNEASPPLSTPTENETPTATVTYRLWNFAILEPIGLATLQARKRKRFTGRRGFGQVQKYEMRTDEMNQNFHEKFWLAF